MIDGIARVARQYCRQRTNRSFPATRTLRRSLKLIVMVGVLISLGFWSGCYHHGGPSLIQGDCSGGSTSGGCTSAGRGGDVTSASFTPTTGDTVVVTMALQNTAAISLTAAGYTWACTTPAANSNFGGAAEICWAFNVPAGTASFTTTGLLYRSLGYNVFDLPNSAGMHDQTGTLVSSTPSTKVSIATAGNLAQNHEAGFCAVTNFTSLGDAPTLDGYTAVAEMELNSTLSSDASYLADTGSSAGSTATCGWNKTSGNIAGQMVTFEVRPAR
jgi:hypothetical protein